MFREACKAASTTSAICAIVGLAAVLPFEGLYASSERNQSKSNSLFFSLPDERECKRSFNNGDDLSELDDGDIPLNSEYLFS